MSGNIFGYHGACTDDNIISDHDPGEYDRIHANPDVISYLDWWGGLVDIKVFGAVICADKPYPGAKSNIVADNDTISCLYVTAAVHAWCASVAGGNIMRI